MFPALPSIFGIALFATLTIEAQEYDTSGTYDTTTDTTDPSGYDDSASYDDWGDLDNDGIYNIEEEAYGTAVDRDDTDGDGLVDGAEIFGTYRIIEQIIETVQTDSTYEWDDNLQDYVETPVFDTITETTEFYIYSNPLEKDSDFDLLPDFYETHTAPLLPQDATDGNSDEDGDGLTRGLEYTLGISHTNPNHDGDEYGDGIEVLLLQSDPNDPNDPPVEEENPEESGGGELISPISTDVTDDQAPETTTPDTTTSTTTTPSTDQTPDPTPLDGNDGSSGGDDAPTVSLMGLRSSVKGGRSRTVGDANELTHIATSITERDQLIDDGWTLVPDSNNIIDEDYVSNDEITEWTLTIIEIDGAQSDDDYVVVREPNGNETVLEPSFGLDETTPYGGSPTVEEALQTNPSTDDRAQALPNAGYAALTDENYPQGTWTSVWLKSDQPLTGPVTRTYLVITKQKLSEEEEEYQASNLQNGFEPDPETPPLFGTVQLTIPSNATESKDAQKSGDTDNIRISGGIVHLEPARGQEITLLPVEFQYVEVLEDGSLQPVEAPQLSDPAPTVEVSRLDVEMVGENTEAEENQAQYNVAIDLAGRLDDALADITPSPDGVVKRLYLIINDGERIAIDKTDGKEESEKLGHKQYDYTGTFDQRVTVTTAVEGINTAKILAIGQTGIESCSLHTFVVSSTTNSISAPIFAMQFSEIPSETTVDVITINDNSGNYEAIESGENSYAFGWVDSDNQARTATMDSTSVSSWSESEIDSFSVEVSDGAGGIQEYNVEETGANSLEFVFAITANNISTNISDIQFVERSEPGPFHPSLIRLVEHNALFVGKNVATGDDLTLELEFPSALRFSNDHQSLWQDAGPEQRNFVVRTENGEPTDDTRLYLSDESGELPGMVVATLPNEDSGWLSSVTGPIDDFKKRFENPETFEEGLGNGLILSGVDIVGGAVRLIEWGGEKGASYVKASIKGGSEGVNEQWESDWQSIVDVGLRVGEIADIAADFIGADEESRKDWIVFLNSLSGEDGNSIEQMGAILRLGTKYTESFSTAAEVWAYASEEVQSLEESKQGLVLGQLIGEIVAAFVPVTKASKLTKAETLTKLSNGKFAKTAEGGSVFARIATFMENILTTKMCFVAGTMVWSSQGAIAIETVQPGTIVLARDEQTGEYGWKPVLHTFVTHPSELFSLTVDVNGDGESDETITGTGEHPFWVEQSGAFVSMRELRPGMLLSIAQSDRSATVIGNVSQRGPPDEFFTTYNFEVEDFHTYFVGESQVWVHNAGGAECERVFAVWHRYRDRGDELWDAYLSTSTRLPNATDDILRKTMKEVSDIFTRRSAQDGRISISPKDQFNMLSTSTREIGDLMRRTTGTRRTAISSSRESKATSQTPRPMSRKESIAAIPPRSLSTPTPD